MHARKAGFGAALALAAGAFLLTTLDPTPGANAEPGASKVSTAQATQQRVNWRIIDGDTYEDLNSGERYRLENIDTPETGSRAQCAAERRLGDRATQQARQFITSAARLDVRRTGRVDRYDRIIAFVEIDGRDLGELMIAEGVARPWRGRREPWCDAGGHLIP